MKSTVEPLEGNKVKLSVEVDEGEFEREVDAAFRRIANDVRIPGFRPGKVPRRILEARIGVEAARADAVQHSLPDFYARAVTEHEVDVIAQPEIDITSGQDDDGPLAFDAVVEVRPVVDVPGYGALRVTIDSPEVTDEDVEERIGHLREQFATLEEVDRPAIDGDHVTIDVRGTQNGEEVPGLTADDYDYEVGRGAVVPEMDENLRGAKPGDIVEFSAEHPEEGQDPLALRILVKAVKARVLPDVDDDFASEASEFDTVEDLRADLRKRLATMKVVQANLQLQERVGEALGELVDIEVPDALVGAEVQGRIQDMAMRLQAQGIDLGTWLAATGQDEQQFVEGLREQSVTGVKVDLGLRAVAEAEGLDVTDEDLEGEVEAVAARVGQSPAKVRDQLERGGQMPLVRSDVRKRKALEWLIEHVEVVDPDGHAIERSALKVEEDDATAEGTEAPDHEAAEQSAPAEEEGK